MKKFLLLILILKLSIGYSQLSDLRTNFQIIVSDSSTSNKLDKKIKHEIVYNDQYYKIIRINSKEGIIDNRGYFLVKPIYNSISYYLNGFALLEKKNKFGLIDTSGSIINPRYDIIRYDKNEIKVTINNKSFYINAKGQCVKDCKNAPADHPRAK